jgi:hypothetical protein
VNKWDDGHRGSVSITGANIDDNAFGRLELSFDGTIISGEFTGADFFNADIGAPADAVAFDGANGLFVSAVAWIGLLNAGQLLIYSGSASDVITPQSVPIA